MSADTDASSLADMYEHALKIALSAAYGQAIPEEAVADFRWIYERIIVRESELSLPTAEPAQQEKMLTPKDVCELLGVSRSTLHTITKRGQLKVTSIGRSKRYAMASIREYIDINTTWRSGDALQENS